MPRFSRSMPSTVSRSRSLAKIPSTNSIFSVLRRSVDRILHATSGVPHAECPSRLLSSDRSSDGHSISTRISLDCPAIILGLQSITEAEIMTHCDQSDCFIRRQDTKLRKQRSKCTSQPRTTMIVGDLPRINRLPPTATPWHVQSTLFTNRKLKKRTYLPVKPRRFED